MLKKICIVIISVTTLLLTGCNFDGEEYKTPTQQAEDDLIIVIDSINNQDTLSIKKLMSDYVIDNNNDIDLAIDKMLEFIDGKIVSYDEPFGTAAGSMEKKDTGAKIEHFTTDKGTEYYIATKQWHRYDEHPEQEGIYNITVKNLSELSKNPDSEEAVFRLNKDT